MEIASRLSIFCKYVWMYWRKERLGYFISLASYHLSWRITTLHSLTMFPFHSQSVTFQYDGILFSAQHTEIMQWILCAPSTWMLKASLQKFNRHTCPSSIACLLTLYVLGAKAFDTQFSKSMDKIMHLYYRQNSQNYWIFTRKKGKTVIELKWCHLHSSLWQQIFIINAPEANVLNGSQSLKSSILIVLILLPQLSLLKSPHSVLQKCLSWQWVHFYRDKYSVSYTF